MACVYPKVKKAGIAFLWLGAVTISIGFVFCVANMRFAFNAIRASTSAPHPSDLASGIAFSLWGLEISFVVAGVFTAVGLVLIVFAMRQNSKRPHDMNRREVE